MLAGLALLLALSAPVPAPKPANDTPAALAPAATDPVTVSTITAEPAPESGSTEPARAAVPIPLPRPARSDAAVMTEATPELPPRPTAAPRRRAVATRGTALSPVVPAMFSATRNPSPAGPAGMVCRDPRIVGAPAATFVGRIPGCGIVDPVRVASISGVALSEPVTVDCRTARKFADWVTGVARPAAREALNSELVSLRVMGSYTCRTRNNSPGARLSEHAAGRAVDIGGMRLADGTDISVESDWGRGAAGAFLRRAWKGACGGFTTVIGPDGDRHHHDHLHFDTASRNSTWCR